jgi:hypothetical protein
MENFWMSECTTATKKAIDRLVRDVCALIEVHYLAEDMDECSDSLVPLYLARACGPLPDQVEHTIAKIEKAVTARPHHSCKGCGALFIGTDDLESHVEFRDPGQTRPIGSCPVCGGDVHPAAPGGSALPFSCMILDVPRDQGHQPTYPAGCSGLH